jgi:hypothetical protein
MTIGVSSARRNADRMRSAGRDALVGFLLQVEGSLAADEPDAWLRVWRGYRHVMHGDPIAGYRGSARDRAPLPDRQWSGRAMAISDFVSDREFRRRRLYAEICKRLTCEPC